MRSAWSVRDTLLLLFLMLLGLGLRLWNVAEPAELYFDEVYYVDAGKALWDGKYDPNSVHPPLGKILIGAGIRASVAIGGEDVNEFFSWRIAAVCAGVLMIGATYSFSLMLFQFNRAAATAAALIVATEHLHLSMTRIAMLDPFLGLFCLLGTWWSFAYFMGGHERWAVLGCFSLGLATGCKWSGLLTAFGCFVVCLFLDRYRNHEYVKSQRYFFWLILILPIGFLLCYAHLFALDGFHLETFKKIFSQGDRMVRFRYDPEQFVHGYKSYFWEWPLVLRPIWLHFEQVGQQVEGVCSLGVWPTWWAFTVLLVERAYTGLVRRKDLVAGALVLLWIGQWLPWAASTTGGFFYYMLPEVPIMALLMGKLFADLANFDDVLGEGRWRGLLLAGVYFAGFLVYLPFVLALDVPRRLFDLLFFLPRWI
jgi:dolichyl-phosphate-mannose-protein mannosyltransferase